MRQTRRKRPTLETAHQFHREGSFLRVSPDHAVSDDEREKLAEDAFRELERLIKNQFHRTGNLEYAILRRI